MHTEKHHRLQTQLDDLEHTIRATAQTRNLPAAVREAIREAVDALVNAQRLLNEERTT